MSANDDDLISVGLDVNKKKVFGGPNTSPSNFVSQIQFDTHSIVIEVKDPGTAGTLSLDVLRIQDQGIIPQNLVASKKKLFSVIIVRFCSYSKQCHKKRTHALFLQDQLQWHLQLIEHSVAIEHTELGCLQRFYSFP
jgi:hypothetical protein